MLTLFPPAVMPPFLCLMIGVPAAVIIAGLPFFLRCAIVLRKGTVFLCKITFLLTSGIRIFRHFVTLPKSTLLPVLLSLPAFCLPAVRCFCLLLDILSKSFRLSRPLDILSGSVVCISRLVYAGLLLLCLFRCGSSLYGAAPGKSIAILCKPSRLCFLYLCH